MIALRAPYDATTAPYSATSSLASPPGAHRPVEPQRVHVPLGGRAYNRVRCPGCVRLLLLPAAGNDFAIHCSSFRAAATPPMASGELFRTHACTYGDKRGSPHSLTSSPPGIAEPKMFQPRRDRSPYASLRGTLYLSALLAAASGCGNEASQDDHDNVSQPQAGDSAVAGSGGSAAGGSDDAGTAGSASAGGAAGTAADGGTSGSGPRAGASGGTAGRAGSSGSAGAAGRGEAGGGEAGGAGDGEPTRATDSAAIAASLADAICDALRGCVGPAKLAALTAREDCVARFGASLAQDDFGSLAASVEAGSVVIDETQLASCYDDTRELGCEIVAKRLPASCQVALAGQRAAGESCTLNSDCSADLFCPIGAQCPRACESTRAAGDACLRDDECRSGLICNAQLCSEPARVGEECAGSSGAVCALGLSCVGSTDTAPGMCQTNASVQVGALGAVCSPGGALCREGLSCAFDSGSTFKCVAAAAEGASCKLALPSQCPSDTYCSATDVTTMGKCLDLPVEGEACVLGDDCAPGHLCVTQSSASTCRRLGNLGDACLADPLCRSGACVDGTCAVRPVCE
jgi:hypothetical protein